MNNQVCTANKALDTSPHLKQRSIRRIGSTPVPVSIKRRPIDERNIAETLERQFSLPQGETRAYLKLLETSGLTLVELAKGLGLTETEVSLLSNNMVAKGLIIEAPGMPKRFAPLHPRMTLTNLFKMYEKDVVEALRERRATVDRVVNLLTPVYEERTGTSST